jgi:hypothetical protein
MERQNQKFDSHLERAKHVARFLFEHIPTSNFVLSDYPKTTVHERVEEIMESKIPFEEPPKRIELVQDLYLGQDYKPVVNIEHITQPTLTGWDSLGDYTDRSL